MMGLQELVVAVMWGMTVSDDGKKILLLCGSYCVCVCVYFFFTTNNNDNKDK